MLPLNIANSDIYIIATFKTINNVIFEKQNIDVLRQLAYIRLITLFDSLIPVIKFKKKE